jgi:hypothetical protein
MRSIQQFLVVGVSVLLVVACSKENTAPPLDPVGGGGGVQPPFDGSLTGQPGVRMTVDGNEVVLVEEGSLVAFADENGQTVPAPGVSSRYFTAGLYDADAKAPAFQLTIGTLPYVAPVVVPKAFEAFLEPGPRPYGPASAGANGVELEYRDNTGQRWSTQCGSGNQNGQQFTITASQFGYDGLGTKVKVVATFTCVFYNCLSGASLPVTDGTLVLDVRTF